MMLNNFYTRHVSPSIDKVRREIIFHFQYALQATILKNSCNFGTINARCLFLVLKERFDDLKQHLFRAFLFYLLNKQSQRLYGCCGRQVSNPRWANIQITSYYICLLVSNLVHLWQNAQQVLYSSANLLHYTAFFACTTYALLFTLCRDVWYNNKNLFT